MCATWTLALLSASSAAGFTSVTTDFHLYGYDISYSSFKNLSTEKTSHFVFSHDLLM